MNAKEKLTLEERNSDNLFKINLFKEGIFLRAINWSAYLLNLVNKEEPLSASKIKSKDITMVSVGFPIKSAGKYLSIFQIDNIDLSQDVIVLDARDFITESFSIEDIEAIISQWAETIPWLKPMPKETSHPKLNSDVNKQPENPYSFMGIMREFLSYDANDNSPANNITFINNMKNKILNLIF